ncbi:MAG: hypothetical protein R6V77_03325 [Candidatus Cloacimonadaceae bacterium]
MKNLPYGGSVNLSGSKSILQRYLFIASLRPCTTILKPGSVCDDVTEMADAVRVCGVKVKQGRDAIAVDSSELKLHYETTVKFTASATALRFWLARALFIKAKTILDVSEELAKRPLLTFIKALKDFGCRVELLEKCSPDCQLRIDITPPDQVPSEVVLDADISSQFISGLMLAGSLAEDHFTIKFKQPPVSYSYLQLTAYLARDLNVNLDLEERGALVQNGRFLRFPETALIEPELSGGAFFLILSVFSRAGIEVKNLSKYRFHPDWEIIAILMDMGAYYKDIDGKTCLQATRLHGIKRDMQNYPDLVPLVAVTALFAETPTVLSGISRLQYKESDRIKGILKAFQTIGAGFLYGSGSLTIYPHKKRPPKAILDTQNDHRLVIAFTLLKLMFPQLELSETASVTKSCPEFFTQLAALKLKD